MKLTHALVSLTLAAACALGGCGTTDTKNTAMRVSEEVVFGGKSQELIDDGFVYKPGTPPPGVTTMNRAQTLALWAGFASAVKDTKISWTSAVAEGELVTLHFSMTATFVTSCFNGQAIASGTTATWTGFVTRQIRNGKVIAEWDLVDLLGLFGQLKAAGPCK